VVFVARIGEDMFGEMALRLYREEDIDISFIHRMAEHPTGVGFILVEAATGNNCIALDPGANELLSAADVEQCDSLDTAAVVMTQLEIPVATAEAALARGRAKGAITILNPAPVRPLPTSVLQLVDVLTPNQTEAKVLTGRSPDAKTEPEEVARDLIRAGVRQVVMTLGEKGALVVTASSCKHVPAMQMHAVDTTGAGDAFNAGIAAALACGESLTSAVELAVITGGLAVTKEGVIPSLPGREEVIQFYQQRSMEPPGWLLSLERMRRA
ncbi:MAG: ribokinase, partial [Candidatus Sulfotelmatobacter sp.]